MTTMVNSAIADQLKKLTKYERARLIAARALQIAQGAPWQIKLNEAELEAISYNPIEIAKKELEADVLPMDIKRRKPRRVEALEEGEVPKV